MGVTPPASTSPPPLPPPPGRRVGRSIEDTHRRVLKTRNNVVAVALERIVVGTRIFLSMVSGSTAFGIKVPTEYNVFNSSSS